jgi:hypothetical protein
MENLSQVESICWSFDTVPSRLTEIFWSNSWEDIRFKMKMRMQYEQIKTIQEYETLCIVVSRALGGGEKPREGVVVPQNKNELQQQMRLMFGK